MRISDWSSDVCSSDLVDQIALIAVGKLIDPRAEQHEAGGARLGLRQIAQLDPLAAGRGRRIGIDRAFEPAVEFAGADPARPCLARLERGDRKSTRLNSSH